jgi:hypothetical protein
MPMSLIACRALALAAAVVAGTGSVYGADFTIGREGAVGAKVHGKVVSAACRNLRSGYIACRTRPLRATVNVTLVEVDGSVHNRHVFTNRHGRFSVSVKPNRYYVFTPLPLVPGMRPEPLEMTVPPGGTTIELRIEAAGSY